MRCVADPGNVVGEAVMVEGVEEALWVFDYDGTPFTERWDLAWLVTALRAGGDELGEGSRWGDKTRKSWGGRSS